MASITISQIDEVTESRLRARAARHGRSIEEEAGEILKCAVTAEEQTGLDLAEEIHRLFGPLGGLELPEFPDEPVRDPPDFK